MHLVYNQVYGKAVHIIASRGKWRYTTRWVARLGQLIIAEPSQENLLATCTTLQKGMCQIHY